ncbi:AMIN domain-containing protein, partial [Pseudophaeobacter sp.]|uniref:AMIN domain-containing protein n=1 Tax=Pseudophaeobacter sp. TaxID=1971739 RepID=UPI003299103D
MSRVSAVVTALWFSTLCLVSGAVAAQDFSGLARVTPESSQISDDGRGASVHLGLSQGVPYRVFTLDGPPRLVLDFQEVDWTGLNTQDFLAGERISSVQFGSYVPGWSRMVLELAGPMEVATAALEVDPVTAAAVLKVALLPSDVESFAAASGAPHDARWDLPEAQDLQVAPVRDENAPLLVVLDPGHG